MKKGLTLIEVIVSIVIASLIFSSILLVLNFISTFQLKRENIWKANKLVENIHARYLNDPTEEVDGELTFVIGEHSLYFDEILERVTASDYDFKVDYLLELKAFSEGNVGEYYELSILNVYFHETSLDIALNLGKWVLHEKQA